MTRKLTLAGVLAVTATAIALGTPPAMAKNHKNPNAANPAHGAANKGCPPGLAKKTPACIPPGQAKKMYQSYDGTHQLGDYYEGDHLPRWYERIDDPYDYDLPEILDGSDYYIKDGVIYRVSPKTRKVLELFELVDTLAN